MTVNRQRFATSMTEFDTFSFTFCDMFPLMRSIYLNKWWRALKIKQNTLNGYWPFATPSPSLALVPLCAFNWLNYRIYFHIDSLLANGLNNFTATFTTVCRHQPDAIAKPIVLCNTAGAGLVIKYNMIHFLYPRLDAVVCRHQTQYRPVRAACYNWRVTFPNASTRLLLLFRLFHSSCFIWL